MWSDHEPPDLAPPSRRVTQVRVGLLAALAYVPLLLTKPGQVGADTKQYLYLDPGRLLERAATMWDPVIGMGTVTHQNIGYLFPMGPWYWVFDRLGAPDWVAQRLWLATVMFAAGAGMLFLFRVLDVRGPGPTAGAVVYMLSPYILTASARLSVLLLPWAGLPWMLALAVLSLRRGGWRHPALFAVVVAVVGGVNATALLYAGIAPALYFPFAVWVERSAGLRHALVTVAKIGGLTLAASLWWIAGLSIQAGYGLNVLEYSESMAAVSKTSLSSESLRGLGYWFFYGGDKLGPWTEASVPYTQSISLLVTSFALPTAAFLAAVLVRWRHRAYFVALVFVGTVVAVGAYPYEAPSLWGSVVKDAARSSTAAFAMRSSTRVVPVVALGCAVLLAAGVSALARTRPRRAAWVAVGLGVLAVGNLLPLRNGGLVADNLKRPEQVPRYWDEAAAWLDAQGHATRVLELPGTDFASYRWGNTIEPVTPGLMDRPYVARELIPWGSPQTADLVNALDRRLQEGVLEPEAIAPIARLMGVGDVVLRSDLQFERFNTPRPRPTWRFFNPPPPGLDAPKRFGEPFRSIPVQFPMLDEIALSEPPNQPDPPPVAAFPVSRPRPIVRAEPATRPLLMAGDGEGMVDAAAAGLLDRPSPVIYAGSLAGDPAALRDVLAADADLLLTDSNRRRARRWSMVREVNGYTEQAGEKRLAEDVADHRLDVFPDADDDAFTVAEHRGVRRVQATGYGNAVAYIPEDRPVHALDGDRFSAWRVGAFEDVRGQRLEVELDAPVTTDRVRVLQPVNGDRNRWITEATLTFDDGPSQKIELGDASRSGRGQWVDIGRRTFTEMTLRVDRANFGAQRSYTGLSAVGVAELAFDGADVRVDEVLRLPPDLLRAAGRGALDHRLDIMLNRDRSSGFPPRADEENFLSRAFALPVGRAFGLTGTARLSLGRSDELIDALLDTGGAAEGAGGEGAIVARSSGRLLGNAQARASSAFDGDRSTAWTPAFIGPPARFVELELPAPVTFDRLDLVVVADGRHSLPKRLTIETDTERRRVRLPEIQNQPSENATVAVPVRLGRPLTAGSLRIVVDDVEVRETRNYFTRNQEPLPVAIAEFGIPGVRMARPSGRFDSGCRTDLITIDGRGVGVRVSGEALRPDGRGALAVSLCGPDAGGMALGPGQHVLRTTAPLLTGIDLDRLVLSSAAGGAALTSPDGQVPPPARAGATAPRVRVEHDGRVTKRIRVTGASEPFWLVLGQSHNRGWEASANGRALGPPTVVDGYANGWLVQPGPAGTAGSAGAAGTVIEVDLVWTPQRRVAVALPVSALALLLCVALALRRPRRGAVAPAAPQPRPASPTRHRGRRPGNAAVVVVAVATFVVVTAVAGPPTGALVAAASVAALLRARARTVLTAGTVGCLAAAGAVTATMQYIARYESVFEWPTFFRVAHNLAWVAVALLAADVVVGLVRERASPGHEL
jgi:hypothetical protein